MSGVSEVDDLQRVGRYGIILLGCGERSLIRGRQRYGVSLHALHRSLFWRGRLLVASPVTRGWP
jgi:hypothetical protein